MIWLPILALTAGLAIVAVAKPEAGTRTGARRSKRLARGGRAAVGRCLPFAWQPEAIDDALEHVLAEHPPEVGYPWTRIFPQKPSTKAAPVRGLAGQPAHTQGADEFDAGEVAVYQSAAPRRRGRASVGAPGGWNEVEIARLVADHVYDHTPDGESIDWPPVPDDCPQVMAIWGRIVIRVRRHLAAIEDGAAEAAWYDAGGR